MWLALRVWVAFEQGRTLESHVFRSVCLVVRQADHWRSMGNFQMSGYEAYKTLRVFLVDFCFILLLNLCRFHHFSSHAKEIILCLVIFGIIATMNSLGVLAFALVLASASAVLENDDIRERHTRSIEGQACSNATGFACKLAYTVCNKETGLCECDSRVSGKRLINQSINQSINPSINRSINQSINLSINHSINPLINPSINRSINVPIIQGKVPESKRYLSWNSGKPHGRSAQAEFGTSDSPWECHCYNSGTLPRVYNFLFNWIIKLKYHTHDCRCSTCHRFIRENHQGVFSTEKKIKQKNQGKNWIFAGHGKYDEKLTGRNGFFFRSFRSS